MFGLSDFQVVWFALGSVANTDQHLIRSPWFAHVSADSDANLWGNLGIERCNQLVSPSTGFYLNRRVSIVISLDSEMTVYSNVNFTGLLLLLEDASLLKMVHLPGYFWCKIKMTTNASRTMIRSTKKGEQGSTWINRSTVAFIEL